MTIKTTRYSPDTCSCVLEYDWDDTLTESERVHTFKTISKCPAHSALADKPAYDSVIEENPRKNNSLQTCLDNGPAGLYDISPTDGTHQLKNGITFNFSWSGNAPNRVLTISFTTSGGGALTTQQKNSVQTFLNNRFGSGKVLIV